MINKTILTFLIAIASPLLQATAQKFIPNDEIKVILIQLNKDFEAYESSTPQQGYCVTIETTPNLHAKLTPYGGSRKSKQLSGFPTDESTYKNSCPFCHYSKNNYQDARIVKNFPDTSYAVKSLSGQILIIPEEHYTHLFTTPFEMQVTILKNVIQVRNENPDKIQAPIEFHCGSAAGQTVFHLHARTGVYVQ